MNPELVQPIDPMQSSIIDAARELFSRYGYKKTTMEDIALALRKGKSSLYYYFKNKEEIFQAVLETEESILFSRLESIVLSDLPPKDKFMQYVTVRMQTIVEIENYVKTLQSDAYVGYEFIDRLKGKSEIKEVEFLYTIILQGQTRGEFSVNNIELAATGMAIALRGIEAPLLKSFESKADLKTQLDNIINILFYGILKR